MPPPYAGVLGASPGPLGWRGGRCGAVRWRRIAGPQVQRAKAPTRREPETRPVGCPGCIYGCPWRRGVQGRPRGLAWKVVWLPEEHPLDIYPHPVTRTEPAQEGTQTLTEPTEPTEPTERTERTERTEGDGGPGHSGAPPKPLTRPKRGRRGPGAAGPQAPTAALEAQGRAPPPPKPLTRPTGAPASTKPLASRAQGPFQPG